MKSLNLTLLVDTEHHGVDRRLNVKAHDVANFFDQLGILRERETLAPMGLQAEGPPNAMSITRRKKPVEIQRTSCL